MKKPIKGEYLESILRSPHTVFTTEDVALLWREDDRAVVTNRLKAYVTDGKLVRLRRGVYAKDAQYDPLEMATRLYTPSYVSFETVLAREGVIFQYYKTIFVATYLTRAVEVNNHHVQLIRVKENILNSAAGIDHTSGYATATKERAILDRMYSGGDYHFDNLAGVDWDRIEELVPLYANKRLERAVAKLKKEQTT